MKWITAAIIRHATVCKSSVLKAYCSLSLGETIGEKPWSLAVVLRRSVGVFEITGYERFWRHGWMTRGLNEQKDESTGGGGRALSCESPQGTPKIAFAREKWRTAQYRYKAIDCSENLWRTLAGPEQDCPKFPGTLLLFKFWFFFLIFFNPSLSNKLLFNAYDFRLLLLFVFLCVCLFAFLFA